MLSSLSCCFRTKYGRAGFLIYFAIEQQYFSSRTFSFSVLCQGLFKRLIVVSKYNMPAIAIKKNKISLLPFIPTVPIVSTFDFFLFIYLSRDNFLYFIF